jgi:hypothetical protein
VQPNDGLLELRFCPKSLNFKLFSHIYGQLHPTAGMLVQPDNKPGNHRLPENPFVSTTWVGYSAWWRSPICKLPCAEVQLERKADLPIDVEMRHA